MFRIKILLTLFVVLSLKPTSSAQVSNADFASLLDSVNVLNERQNPDRHEELVEELSEKFHPKLNLKNQIRYFYYQGDFALERNNIPAAEAILLKADSLSALEDSNYLIFPIKNALGNLYHIMGRPDISVEYQEFTLENIPIKNQDSSAYYAVMINLSNAYSNLGHSDLALNYLLQARDHFRQIEGAQLLPIILNNLGELYRKDYKDNHSALKHYQEAKQLNLALGNTKDLISNYNNMSLAFTDLGRHDSALYYARESIQLRKDIGDYGGLGQAYFTLGSALISIKAFHEARENLQISLSICDSLNIMIGSLNCHIKLARIALSTGDPEQAIIHLKQAQNINDQYLGGLQEGQDISEALTEVYEEQGQFEEAYQSLKEYQRFSDSLELQKDQSELNRLKSEYEKELALAENKVLKINERNQSAKLQTNRWLLGLAILVSLVLLILILRLMKISSMKQKALAQLQEAEGKLRLQMEELESKKEELEKANSFKNQILSVMGHDLRSPLAGVAGLLGTVSASEINREELSELLAMLKTETDRSLISLQNVLNWARLQMEDVRIFRSELNLDLLFKEIIFHYGPGKRTKNLSIEFKNELEQKLWADEHQFRSMCGNLLSNAIKFSPENGHILIKAERVGEEACISICDDGEGIDQGVLQKLNSHERLESKRGTQGEKGTGIGLAIVYDFIKIHRGRLEFQNRIEGGTCAQLFFPLRSKLDD